MIKELDDKQIKMLDNITMQYNHNQELLSCEEVIEDENKLKYLSSEINKISKVVSLYKQYSNLLSEYKSLDGFSDDDELKVLAKETKDKLGNVINGLAGEITTLLAENNNDYNSIIVELFSKVDNQLTKTIKSGIINTCKNYGYSYSIIDKQNGDTEYNISGFGCYEKFRSLSGINKDNAMNIVTVIIYAQTKLKYFSGNDEIKISAYRSSGAGGQNINKLSTAIRATHIPTNITVTNQDERTQLQNKNKALESLKIKVNDYYKSLYDKEIKKQKESQLKNVSRGTVSNLFNFEKNKISGIITTSITEFEKGNI